MMHVKREQPLLSIVIPNYNYGRFLEDAIWSVLRQCDDKLRLPTGEQIELIIVDGGSTDNSLEIIQSFSDRLDGVRFGEGEEVLKCESSQVIKLEERILTTNLELQNPQTRFFWCSEKDRGQSDAFNKGFEHAQGKYLTWVNADDVLVPGAIHAILCQLRRHPECEWFTGNFYRFNDVTGKVLEIGWGPHIYPRWMQRKNSPIVSFGPSTIFSKDLWLRNGKVDVDLHLMMDTDMWMRFIVAGVKQRRINHFVWGFRMHEESKTAEFGDHKLDADQQRRFALENQLTVERTGYHCSKFWRFAVLILRLIDGSLLRRYYYKKVLRRV